MAMARFKLVFFVPTKDTRQVLDAFFKKVPEVAGRIGLYEQCAFITRGTGQFKPMEGANPTHGHVGQVESVQEDRVEVVISDKGSHNEIRKAVEELKAVHPYEEVAYDVYKLEDF
ncbi:hypothetical protein HGRIS_001869 [Hohenbuehelia grisea]|uniref:ATP phosphoribosyltransferase n=1 Tax=Hohenbuehelia grisea TaxID=104357 RepID=A0ABR3JIT5_9AGAR